MDMKKHRTLLILLGLFVIATFQAIAQILHFFLQATLPSCSLSSLQAHS